MMHNYKKIKWMFFALVAIGLAVSACIFSKFVSAMPQKEMTSLDAMPARVLVFGGQEVFVRPALKSFPESNEQKFKDTFDNAIISSQTDQYRKDQLFIRFKEGTGLCVVATDLIKDKKKFEQVTGTKNLDILNETYAVQELKPLINSDSLASRQHFVGSISSHLAKSIEQKQKQQIADSIKEMNTRYPKRSRHAIPDLQAHLAAKLTNTFIMVFNSEKVTIGEVKAAYENDPNVESVEFISKAYIYYEPTDPYYSSTGTWGNVYRDMYGLTPDFMHAGDPIATQGAWAKSKGDGVIIAVIDTGVDYAHPDIKANMWQNKSGHYGYDFVSDDTDPMDDQGHGTHCAGTIAAAENSLGVIGVAPLSKIMALKGLDSQGNGYDDDLASAVFYAVENGADITSSSWGGIGYSFILENVFDFAHASGCVNVVAAGNSDTDVIYSTPANIRSVIDVAASDFNHEKASFSNHGFKIDVSAPGVDVLSLRATGTNMYGDETHIVDNNYYRASGTSMACPHVAGVVALMKAQHPDWTNEELRSALRVSATDLGNPGFDIYFGYGLVNANAALEVQAPIAARIFSPQQHQQHFENETIEIRGVAYGQSFNSYKVEYAQSMDGPWLLADNAKATEQKNLEIGPNGEIAYPILATLNVLEINTLLYFKLTAFDQNNRAYIDLVQIFNNWNNGKIFASNETDQDAFGFYGLLISNDTAIIATPTANNFKGAAYLFSRNSDGSWPHQETKKLSIGNNVSTSFFGWGVSIFDDTAVVGADSFACVYDRNPDGSWPSQYTQLIQGFPQPGHSRLFGNTVFLTENTLFVSDANATVNNVKSGAVYIFNKNANGAWPENASQIIAPSDGVINSAFGTSLCAQDNTLVVSAPCWSANRSGEIYIFTRDPNTGLWSENQIIFPSDAVPKNYFGEAVSISGETLVVGSDGINSSNIGAGAAYIFIKNTDGTWPQEETQKILPSDGIPGQFFGRSISIDDDVILVGSYGGSNQEGAYLFKKNAEGSWPATETKRILPPDGSSPDLFGAQVFVAANKMLIGNPLGHGATPMVGNAFIISKHLISGIISENGIPLKDVVVRTGDPDIEPVTTTVDGHYQFVVPERWSGWIRLSKDGYCFNPDNGTSTYTHVIDDIIQDYTAITSSAEQTLDLKAGWNMISFNIHPENPSIENIFETLVAEEKLDIVKDGAGRVFWPAYNIDTIKNINVEEGYSVRVNQDATLSIQGGAIVLPKTISINSGWNMIAYPMIFPKPITDVFEGNESNFVIIQDGEGHIYWPENNINTIDQMQPGKGYYIKVLQPFNIIFN